MKQFDFYEFAGILTPGALILFGLSQIFPGLGLPIAAENMSVADLGLFTILSYAAGHLVQVLGDGIEFLWWRPWGGMPSEWVLSGKSSYKRRLISDEQAKLVLEKSKSSLGVASTHTTLASIPEKDWSPLTRQIYAAVAKAKLAERVNAFNRTYGLLRGMAAGLLVMAAALYYKSGGSAYKEEVLLLVLCGAALVRMHLYARNYARELFVQFLLV
jgi:hypothetical protein